jgi:hypothetical protein
MPLKEKSKLSNTEKLRAIFAYRAAILEPFIDKFSDFKLINSDNIDDYEKGIEQLLEREAEYLFEDIINLPVNEELDNLINFLCKKSGSTVINCALFTKEMLYMVARGEGR